MTFALGALGASSAIAAPQVGRCVAQSGTGKYKDSNCSKKAGAKPEEKAFEFVKNAVQKGFTLAGGVAVFEARGGQVVCAHETGSGEYLESGKTPSTKQVRHVVSRFTECELSFDHSPCQSAGQPSGTIVTGSLAGKMGYFEAFEQSAVGQELHAESAKARFASFSCSGGATTIEIAKGPNANTAGGGRGCVIATLGPTNQMTVFDTLTYSSKNTLEHFQQVPETFKGSTRSCHLEWSISGHAGFEIATLTRGSTITNEEALEIKA